MIEAKEFIFSSNFPIAFKIKTGKGFFEGGIIVVVGVGTQNSFGVPDSSEIIGIIRDAQTTV